MDKPSVLSDYFQPHWIRASYLSHYSVVAITKKLFSMKIKLFVIKLIWKNSTATEKENFGDISTTERQKSSAKFLPWTELTKTGQFSLNPIRTKSFVIILWTELRGIRNRNKIIALYNQTNCFIVMGLISTALNVSQ